MSAETPTWEEQQEYSHVEGPTNPSGPDARPADGSKVGNPLDTTQTSLETPDKNKSPLLKPPTLEEMTLQRAASTRKLDAAAKENPDWPPAKGSPEAEKKLSGDLEAGMSSVV